jgi:thiol-disulfide isomerase/thioredoxin
VTLSILILFIFLFISRINNTTNRDLSEKGNSFQRSSSSTVLKDDINEDQSDVNQLSDEKEVVFVSDTNYLNFSKSVLTQTQNTRRVLFFYANWCPTCKAAEENIKSNLGKLPQDVTIIRVNYNDTDTDDDEKDLAKKYSITYQHTFVQIDSQENEITKWNGGEIDILLSKIK